MDRHARSVGRLSPKEAIITPNSQAVAAPPAIHEPGRYRIRVVGRLGPEWADRTGGMEILVCEEGGSRGVTELMGTVTDQAALQGLLEQLYARGCVLLGVELLDAASGTGLSAETGVTELLQGRHSEIETNQKRDQCHFTFSGPCVSTVS